MSAFGEMEYCLLCKDKTTGHPKGSAFVKFVDEKDAQAVLTSDSETLTLDGRVLYVSPALPREDIDKKMTEKNAKGKDRRNLYLAREGLILAGTPAAEGVSPSDLEKRLQLEMKKRKLLRILTNFVSKTRLCVHNIPPEWDNLKLKKLFLSNAGDRKAKIVECRIMKNKLASGKLGKSKGFGFVEFEEHTHALEVLRRLNNNPTVFTDAKRPIVEFAIEDKFALNIKKKRQEQLEKLKAEQIAENANLEPLGKKAAITCDKGDKQVSARKRRWLQRLDKLKEKRKAQIEMKKNSTESDSGNSKNGDKTVNKENVNGHKKNDNKNIDKKTKRKDKKDKKHSKEEQIKTHSAASDTKTFSSGFQAEPPKGGEKIQPIPKLTRKLTESKKEIRKQKVESKISKKKEKVEAIHEERRSKKVEKRKAAAEMRREKVEKMKEMDDFEEQFIQKSGVRTLVDDQERVSSKKVKKNKWFKE